MPSKLVVSPLAFEAIQRVDTDLLAKLREDEIRPLLPCLVRMSLCAPLDQSQEWSNKRKTILKVLSGIEQVNSLVALLSIDFQTLEIDFKKEQQLRAKIGGVSTNESALISSVQNGMALDFERSDATRRLRLLLYELLTIMLQVKEGRAECLNSELFDTEVYLEEVADVLCIAKAEFPSLLLTPEIVEALVHVRHGPDLICRLVTNIPDTFKEACTTLIVNGEKQEEDSKGGQLRIQAIRQLCFMNMPQTLAVRAKAVELCAMPGLVLLLTLDYNCRTPNRIVTPGKTIIGSREDLVTFVSSLLLGPDDRVRSWFSQYVRISQKKADMFALGQLREELLSYLQSMVGPSGEISEHIVVQASSLLRLYCALRGIAGLKFNEEEINGILSLLTAKPAATRAGVRFVSLGLCTVLACPSLITGSSENDRRVTNWIRWLLAEESSTLGHVEGASFGEMLLLVAIHFHSGQLSSIAELVCSTLGMKIPVRQNNLARMRTIFTQEIFTDQVVTTHAVKVPVTPNLSKYTPGFLPVHCIHQLLRSRAFTKYKVPIKDWIYQQICQAVPPLHPVLPPLVEVFVNSVLVPSSRSAQDTTNEPIGEAEIMEVFRRSPLVAEAEDVVTTTSSKDFAPQLLLLYYLLLYEDTRLANIRQISASAKRYSPQFMARLPIFYLVQVAHREQESYSRLFSPLLRLLATHYPHLCLVEHWLAETSSPPPPISGTSNGIFPQNLSKSSSSTRFTKQSLAEAIQVATTCPYHLERHLSYLSSVPLPSLWPYVATFVESLPLLLEPGVPRTLLEAAHHVWTRANSVFPRRLWLMTLNALRSGPRDPFVTPRPLALDDVVLDPLYVLRCDERVFRCASILSMILHMLRAFLAASRTKLYHHTLEHPLPQPLAGTDHHRKAATLSQEAEREELRAALVSAQESAAVQILLEACLPTEKDKKVSGFLNNLHEIQSLIFSHLHQVFIDDPTLVKLVHFQGYPSELLSVTVSSIPSLHICLDFLPELLSQPILDKQIFAVELASHLCIQYPIAKSLSIARLCINVSNTLLEVLSSDQRGKFFLSALPALVRMCEAFPPLCEEVSMLLFHMGRICMAHSCVTSATIPDFIFPESLFEDAKWIHSNTLLGKVIQECFAKLCDVVSHNRDIF